MVTYDHQLEETSSAETQINLTDPSSAVIRRSYECFYCKRGFNTAQALGGHMNIHRKDRANKSKKPSASNEPKESKIYQENPNFLVNRTNLPDSRSYIDRDHYLQLGLMNYGANYTTSSAEYSCGNVHLQLHNKDHRRDTYYEYHHHRQPFNHSTIEACDWTTRSSSEYYSAMIVEEDLEMNKQVTVDYDEDLDLELRLGYI